MVAIVTIPKKVSGGNELVVIKRNDFEAFKKWQTETADALRKVQRARAEHRSKKTKTAKSPRKFR